MTTMRLAALLGAFTPAMALGQSCITGRVIDAGAGQPIAAAAVSADWTVGGTQRLRTGKETTTDSLGRYRLCLSRDAAVLVHAIVGGTVAYLPITTPKRGDTTLDDLKVPSEGDTGTAVVAGHVVSENGAPVEGATVTILGGHSATPTDADGGYGLRGPEGSQVLVVRRVGLGAAVVPITLSGKQPRLLNVTMQRLPPTLDVVTVVADRLRLGPVYAEIGLTTRARSGHGHILTLDDIERKQPSETIDLLQGMPGVRFRYDKDGHLKVFPDRSARFSTINSYGDCTAYIVDGVLMGNGHAVYTVDQRDIPQGNADETALPPPPDLIAVEVYQPGEPTPSASGMVDRCLKVFLWTKAMLEKP